MESAEERIIYYEERLARGKEPPDKIAALNEARDKLLNAAKSDLAREINAFTRQFIGMPEEYFDLRIHGRTSPSPMITLYPLLNNINRICKEISELGKYPKYRMLSGVLIRFANGVESIKRHLIKGAFTRKDQVAAQYTMMLKDVLNDLERSGFGLNNITVVS